jgi:hypothetical protein
MAAAPRMKSKVERFRVQRSGLKNLQTAIIRGIHFAELTQPTVEWEKMNKQYQ